MWLNDIGSWESVWSCSEKDLDGNAIKGKVFAQDTKFSHGSEEKLVVTLGLQNIMLLKQEMRY